MAPLPRETTLLSVAAEPVRPNRRRPMRALAYLLGARALDAAREPETGIRWAKPEEPLGPIATTEATAAAWRRWRDRAYAETAPPAPKRAPSPVIRRAGTPG